MIYEVLIKVFNGDKTKAWRALGLLVGLVESHGESYGNDDWDEDYREIHLALLDSLRKEHRTWL